MNRSTCFGRISWGLVSSSEGKTISRRSEILKMTTQNEEDFLLWGILRGKEIPVHLDRHSMVQWQRVTAGDSERLSSQLPLTS